MLDESTIHRAVRDFLRGHGWLLVAGQFPDGSDDELPTLNVMDPEVARDGSPDPRRHSRGKLVPDLVALKGRLLLIIEIKPRHSRSDREKLLNLLGSRRQHLLHYLGELARNHDIPLAQPLSDLTLKGAQALSAGQYIPTQDFAYFRVLGLEEVLVEHPREWWAS
jgi:hypothetical protein